MTRILTWMWNMLFPQRMTVFSLDQAISILSIRDSRWRKIRVKHVKENPRCAVCGSEINLSVHHIVPVHVDRSKELCEDNLITLCQNSTMNCHFIFGHLLNWKKSNPNIVEDAKLWSKKLSEAA